MLSYFLLSVIIIILVGNLIYKAPYGRNFRGAEAWQIGLAACSPKCLIELVKF